MRPLALVVDGTLRHALAYAEGGRVVALAGDWDEGKHPRQPEGTDKGGEFAPADAAAFEAVHAAFQPAKEHIAKQYEERVTSLFEKMKTDHGEQLKGIHNSWTWARTFNSTVRDNLKSDIIDPSKSPYMPDNKKYSIDSDKLRANGVRFADMSVREGARKVLAKLGKVESISANIYSDNNYFHVTAMKGARKISIQQQMIINVSSRGTLFNQWPARIYVDGKAVSEAKYKKGEYTQEEELFAQRDYAALKPRLDALEAAALDALRDALGESRDALVSKVRKASDFAALVNDLKRLPRYGAVEMEVRAMLDRAREAGRKDARREVREGRRDFAFDPNQSRDPLGTRTGGRWTPKDVADLSPAELWSDGQEYEGRLFGGAYDNSRIVGRMVAKDAPMRAAILQARVRYNAIRERLGLESVQDWAVRPSRDRLVQSQPKPAAEFAQHDFADSSFTPKAATRWLRATAFWVAGILGDRVLADVKGIILNGLKTGTASSVMADQIFDAFLPWLGDPDVIRDEQQLQPWRLETIVRTNTTTAYNHGRLTEFVDPEVLRFVKGIRYSAILDERTTEVCRFLDGKVFKPTDPNLEALLPPNHFSCRSIIVPIVAGEQVREDEFITPEEIGKARGLADAKFLAQDDAWKAYREREEEPTVIHVPDPEAERRAVDSTALAEAARTKLTEAQAKQAEAERALASERKANAAALKALAERKIEVTVQAPAVQRIEAPAPQDMEIENLATGARFRVTRTEPKKED